MTRQRGLLTIAGALLMGIFSSDRTNHHSSSQAVTASTLKSRINKRVALEDRKIRWGLKYFNVHEGRFLCLNLKNAKRKYWNWKYQGICDIVEYEGKLYIETKPAKA